MAAKTDDEERFERYREHLKHEATRLACYVRVYRRLHEHRHDRLDEMNIAPAFFTTVTDALFSAVVLWVDKLCDERAERGLYNFLAFVENHRNLFGRRNIDFQLIQQDRDAIRGFAPLQSFRLRRDKFHAHFDKDYFFDRKRLGEDAPLRWVDLEDTLSLVGDVLNRYSVAYDGNRFVLEPMNAGDLDDLLNELHEARTAQEDS